MGDTKEKNSVKSYAKYSGMAFQLFAITAVGTGIGHYFDNRFHFQTPYLSAAGAIVFLIMALYLVLKNLLKSN